MVIDSHAHLLDPLLRDRAEEILRDLRQDGVECIVEVGTDFKDSRMSLKFAEAHDNVYCTIGVHPMFAGTYDTGFEEWAIAQKSEKIVAVGECGLDYFHMDYPKDVQRETFVRQIKLAARLGLPLVVHSRDAFEDMYETLNANKKFLKNGVILHCFSGGAEEVERFKAFDAYFAFGGAVTYKNACKAAEAIRVVPENRLLIETDCPYLAPVPFRGQINEPKNVKIVAERIAAITNLTFDEVAKLTTANARRIINRT